MIIIEKHKKEFGNNLTCGNCAFGKPNEEYPDGLVDCKIYKTFYNVDHEKCKRFRPSIIKRDCDFCVFETFHELAIDYLCKNHLSTEFLSTKQFSQKYCSILDKFIYFPLKEPCPHHAYKLYEIPNPFFHNNHICPFCDKKVKKKDEKGRCRIQSGKSYQWYHLDCKKSSGINIMGFLDLRLKLML